VGFSKSNALFPMSLIVQLRGHHESVERTLNLGFHGAFHSCHRPSINSHIHNFLSRGVGHIRTLCASIDRKAQHLGQRRSKMSGFMVLMHEAYPY
jgi:hypothetical protein